jgi:hypothetical protein
MYEKATAGFGYYNQDNELVIGWTNEVQVTDICKLIGE